MQYVPTTGDRVADLTPAAWSTKMKVFTPHRADVAELADALDSGSSSRKGVEVQVLSSAPIQDILLIETPHGLDYVRAADAAKRVFAARGTHSFPSEFVMPAEWRPEIEALVTQLGFAETPAASILERFRFVLQRLAEAALR
jgi:hypothetical protein